MWHGIAACRALPGRRAGGDIVLVLLLASLACTDTPSSPDASPDLPPPAASAATAANGAYEFAPPVFDIAAAPNGNILVAETVFPVVAAGMGRTMTTVKEIRRTGRRSGIREVTQISTTPGSPINGLAAAGARSFFATSGGKDLALGAGVWHVTPGGQRLVGDVETFETIRDPDAAFWKVPACEFNPMAGFSPGPQSNPYHLVRQSGSTALVADGAGNTLLEVGKNGTVDWVAVFTPPVDDGSSSSDPEDWMVLFPIPSLDVECYVQPVPTSVAIGPDGAYYVGELTGVTPGDLGGPGPTTGLSRVWRIERGARNVVCPSADCTRFLDGFTSVIDLAFGPDGYLYVVEYDEAGWFTATEVAATSGTINRCDTEAGACQVAGDGLALPSAITFDKRGNLWLLENNLGLPGVGAGTPTVRQVAY